jgi:hypothetical protein
VPAAAGGVGGRVGGEENALVMHVAPFVRGCSHGCVAGGGSSDDDG